MTAFLLGLLPTIWPYLVAGIGGLAALFFARRSGVKAERNARRAKDADAYEKHLKEIADAADARNSISVDRLPERDPYRRD